MVKEGNTVKNYKFNDSDPETITIGVTVYFPEVDDDGSIDLGNWCLSQEEAELKERWLSYVRKLQGEYSRLERRKNEFWTITCEELGLEKYAGKKEEPKRTSQI